MKLYPYQQEGVEFLEQRERALLCDAPGLGKTAQAVVAAEKLDAEHVLVVCPNIVKWQWEQEIGQWAGFGAIVCGQGREGVDPWLGAWPAWKYSIIHWSALRMLPDSFFKRNWDVLIADELHYACNRKAQRTKALKRIKATYKWGLGATPYRKWVDDLWSILNWLDKKQWSSYWRFYRRYLTYLDTGTYREILGERNMDELADALSDVVLRRTKAEVAQWLPPLTETVLPVELPESVRSSYEQWKREVRILLANDREYFILNPLQRTTLLRRATNATRTNAAVDLFDTLEGPTVIFTYFRDTAERIASTLRTAYLITGSTPEARRIHQLHSWRSLATRYRAVDGDWVTPAPVLVMTLGVGGVGLSLDEADNVIFAGMSWSSVEMEQAVERIHRVTSRRPKHAYYIMCRDTIDEAVLWAAKAKADRRAYALAALRHIIGGTHEDATGLC